MILRTTHSPAAKPRSGGTLIRGTMPDARHSEREALEKLLDGNLGTYSLYRWSVALLLGGGWFYAAETCALPVPSYRSRGGARFRSTPSTAATTTEHHRP